MRETRLCSIEGCGRKHSARGWCIQHYRRWRRHGVSYADVPIGVYVNHHVLEHGTVNEYNNYGCRCGPCRAAMAEYQRRIMEQPCANGCGNMVWNRGPGYARDPLCRTCEAASRVIPLEERHGTEVGYSKGCRCRPCRDASAKARRDRRAALSPEAREADRSRERERFHRRAASMRA